MKAGYPPIDIKFADRIAYYNAFDEYHAKHNLGAMEKLFAGYVNARCNLATKLYHKTNHGVFAEKGIYSQSCWKAIWNVRSTD